MKPYGEVDMDLMEVLPCVNANIAVETIGVLRSSISKKSNDINQILVMNDRDTRSLKLVCEEYIEMSQEETCDKAGKFIRTNYGLTVCSARSSKLLSSFNTPFYPEVNGEHGGCGYPNITWDEGARFHEYAAKDFENRYTRCTSSDAEACSNYSPVHILPDAYDEALTYANTVMALTHIVTDTQKLLTCGFVKDAFRALTPECHKTIDSLKIIWAGTATIAVSFFAMWVTLIITVNRLLNKDQLIKSMKTMLTSRKSFWKPPPEIREIEKHASDPEK